MRKSASIRSAGCICVWLISTSCSEPKSSGDTSSAAEAGGEGEGGAGGDEGTGTAEGNGDDSGGGGENPSYVEAVEGDSPVVWWRLGEASGTTAWDENEEFPGTYSGVTLGMQGALAGSGDSNGAVGFSPEDLSVVEVSLTGSGGPVFDSLFNGSFSFEVWLLDEAGGPDGEQNYEIFDTTRENDSNGRVWFYRDRRDGTYSFNMDDSTGAANSIGFGNPGGTGSAGDGMWHHYVIVFDRTEGMAHGYKDGALSGSSALTTVQPVAGLSRLLIGKNDSVFSWKGRIDEVILFGEALSAEQVSTHYQAGALPR